MASVPRVITRDPSTPSGIILPRSIFDQEHHRNFRQPWAMRISGGRALICDPNGQVHRALDMPTDDLLIATAVEYGMPRWAAEQCRENVYRRYDLLAFWNVVQDAAEGDIEARERLDASRGKWDEMRQVELVSDRPGHTIGLWER